MPKITDLPAGANLSGSELLPAVQGGTTVKLTTQLLADYLADVTVSDTGIQTLPNVSSIQGKSINLADAGADAIFGWDDTGGEYENLTRAKAQAVLGIETLTGSRTYFVRTDGSDSNTGLTNTAGGAFLTIQKAVNSVYALDNRGFDVTIQVGSGTYTGAVRLAGRHTGIGKLTMLGNVTTPTNVVISVTGNDALVVRDGATIDLGGFHISSDATPLLIIDRGRVEIVGKMKYTGATGGEGALGLIACERGYYQNLDTGTALGYDYTLAGEGFAALYADPQAFFHERNCTITLESTPAFSYFAYSVGDSSFIHRGATFTGSATGQRFRLARNAYFNTNNAGLTYFPGDEAGEIRAGGAYDERQYGETGAILITESTASAVATLSFALTNYLHFRKLVFELTNIRPADDGVALAARLSTDSGATYVADTGVYSWAIMARADDGTDMSANSNSQSNIRLTPIMGNASAECGHAVVTLSNMTSTAKWPALRSEAQTVDNNAPPRAVVGHGAGVLQVAQNTNGIRFRMTNGGNFSVIYAIYGYL
jgi:hypothetical protein